MRRILSFILPLLSLSLAQADSASVDQKVAVFKNQSSTLQRQLLEIEKIAVGCEAYRERIENELVAKSKVARQQLADLSERLDAIVGSADRAEAQRVLNEVGVRLQKALKGTSAPENVKNVKFVLSCARPGNSTVERKMDNAIKTLQGLIAIQQSIVSELK